MKLRRAILPIELTQDIVHPKAITWQKPGILSKSSSPSSFAENEEFNDKKKYISNKHVIFIILFYHPQYHSYFLDNATW